MHDLLNFIHSYNDKVPIPKARTTTPPIPPKDSAQRIRSYASSPYSTFATPLLAPVLDPLALVGHKSLFSRLLVG